MKYWELISIFIFSTLSTHNIFYSQNSTSIVKNVKFSQRIDDGYIIYYDASGISSVKNKYIVRDFDNEKAYSIDDQFNTKIIATDNFYSFETGAVTDIDGNIYKTVKIGNQWWMAEDLKVTHYRNGDSIPNIRINAKWAILTTGALCSYNNDNKLTIYGRLYNWYAVDDNRHIAPAGWHVPSDSEWQALINYLGGGSIAGGKMKETGTIHWPIPNTGATNESCFSALPADFRIDSGIFSGLRNRAHFWSSTEKSSENAWGYFLSYYFSDVFRSDYKKSCGFLVRCVRDN
jgi:uncharacterized protein (TIGR02145 family)